MAARANNIQTVAERVEDANTMAVLWQIGVQYIQGYFVNEPEEVVLHALSAAPRGAARSSLPGPGRSARNCEFTSNHW